MTDSIPLQRTGRPRLHPLERKTQTQLSLTGYDWKNIEYAAYKLGVPLKNFLLYATREFCRLKGYPVYDEPIKAPKVKRPRGRPPKVSKAEPPIEQLPIAVKPKTILRKRAKIGIQLTPKKPI